MHLAVFEDGCQANLVIGPSLFPVNGAKIFYAFDLACRSFDADARSYVVFSFDRRIWNVGA